MRETWTVQQWRTGDRPEDEQYSYWREVVCQAFTPLRPVARGTRDSWDRKGLSGWVDTHPYGEVNGAELETCDQTIYHGREEINCLEDEVVFVNLMLRGRCVVSQSTSTCLSSAGTFSIVDATRPFCLDFLDTNWRAISFRIPTHSLTDGLPSDITAVTYPTARGVASVVADTMRAAWRSAATLTDTQARGVGAALASLVGTLPHGGGISDYTGVGEDAIRDSIEHFVVRHLLYGDTSPTAVASHFGISVRKLHQLYRTAPTTFSETVMRLRTQLCSDDLLAGEGHVTLTDTAMKWGFSDLSHMNRVFQRHFGYRAAEYTRIRSTEAPASGISLTETL